MAKKWYVVHTYSGYENKAKLALEQAIVRAALQERFGEVLVPTESVVEVRNGQKKTTTRKVYPGYMFVQMESDRETRHVVTSTPKVTGFIGGSSNPPPVPESEVLRLLGQAVEAEEKPKAVVNFTRGDEVRIIEGSFASLVGKVEGVNPARAKLRVMVSIFGRPTAVELDFTQVERLG
ncbi:MAG: transcription termination/antitermination protein NusG [Rhodobacterales bacterium]|nr:transcription termination/antitermination protein NusG [Rhodobacterales bacterium]